MTETYIVIDEENHDCSNKDDSDDFLLMQTYWDHKQR